MFGRLGRAGGWCAVGGVVAESILTMSSPVAPVARAVVIASAVQVSAPRAEFAVPPRSRVPTPTGVQVGVDTAASSGLSPG